MNNELFYVWGIANGKAISGHCTQTEYDNLPKNFIVLGKIEIQRKTYSLIEAIK